MSGRQFVDRVVMIRTAQGNDVKLAHVVGYADRPTFMFSREDGAGTWIAELCRAATPEEEIRYWRRRAEGAEAHVCPTDQRSSTPTPREPSQGEER